MFQLTLFKTQPPKKLPESFLGYKLKVMKRPYQRSIKLTVKYTGEILMTCSKTTSNSKLLEFLLESESWIEKIQKKYEIEKQKRPLKKVAHGESFYFLGRPRVLNLKIHKSNAYEVTEDELRLYLKQTQAEPQILEHLKKLYKKQGKALLIKKVNHWSQVMGLYPTKLSFRAQKTRWGSCSSLGHVSLNWKLILAPEFVIDYVVIHELAHLKHQNHSKRFWNLVSQYTDRTADSKNWLKKHYFEFEFLDR
ncbi:MAG: M48 family metallopeptidase [Bdellovibrionales bacterium]|nr:M48 family metallopeptidase [Bdellovibrionales bacterium]